MKPTRNARRCRGYVYVAGPYSTGDRLANVKAAMRIADMLEDRGFVAFVPHLNHYRNRLKPRPEEHWIRVGLLWLAKCNALVRLSGHSTGADLEMQEAIRRGIPVVLADAVSDDWIARLESALRRWRRDRRRRWADSPF